VSEGPRFLNTARGSLILYVGTDESPHDEEWEAYVTSIESRGDEYKKLRIIGFVGAGAPTPVQRKRLMRRLGTIPHCVSIVSSSFTARAIVTVLHWLGLKIRAFSPDAVDEAFRHLELGEEESHWVLSNERTLRERLKAG
jgi:hypothetical protein